MRIPVRDAQVGAWGRAEDGCEKRCSGGLSAESGSPLMPVSASPPVAAVPAPPLVPVAESGLWHAGASSAIHPA